MRINSEKEDEPEIGLIALIDCIFFLLMFFMVATSFKQTTEQKKLKELPLELPKSAVSLSAAGAAQEALVLGVDRDGKFYWGSEKISAQALHERLKKEAEVNPNRRIRIDGDQHTSYNNIVHLLDLCEFEGFTRIALRTRT